MPGLSSPIAALKPYYDVLVVGSGYGGAISASLLSRARKGDGSRVRVCLLERGKEITLGGFPTNPTQAARELQINAEGAQVGSEDALYWLHRGRDISVFQGCGLGGTSLINANVALRPEKRVWQDAHWPEELIRDLSDGIEKGFRRAEHMLGAKPYPAKVPLRKYVALARSAERIGGKLHSPPIAVNFEAGINAAGMHQPKCERCGDCVSGCNSGAKNTLAMNYLPDAKKHGADIFCSVRVLRVSQNGRGWTIHFQAAGAQRENRHREAGLVEAGTVVLSAGALGSTEILLRSKQNGLPCSPRVGDRFSGNGDALGFAYDTEVSINGIGNGERHVAEHEAAGPCTTGIIDCRDTDRTEHPHLIEEGVIPGALAPLLTQPLRLAAELQGRSTDSPPCHELEALTRAWLNAPDAAYLGAMQRTQTLLAMARDNAAGRIVLEKDNPTVCWPSAVSAPQLRYLHERLSRATAALGGTYVPSASVNHALHSLVTIHPLGGCSMADDATRGATNHMGQVFSTGEGTRVHDSLYVSDGAILPCALGANPLLTIAAIAERNTRLLVRDAGWTVEDSP